MPTLNIDMHLAPEFDKAIECMGRIHRAIDKYTADHNTIVGKLVEALALTMSVSSLGAHTLNYAARLHDVGKISIDADVLHAPRALTASEWVQMKEHPAAGAKILMENNTPFFGLAADIAATHHEYCDGSGYPLGIAGGRITLAAKMVTVCDIYEALRTDRLYKKGYSHNETMAIFSQGDDRVNVAMFDPAVLEGFYRAAPVFAKIYDRKTAT